LVESKTSVMKHEYNDGAVAGGGDDRDKSPKQVAVGDREWTDAKKYAEESKVFEEEVMQKEKLGIIYLWSPVDEKCVEFLSTIEDVEKELAAAIIVNKIDVYKNATPLERLGTTEVPGLAYTKNGELISGDKELSKEHITNILNNLQKQVSMLLHGWVYWMFILVGAWFGSRIVVKYFM
jgi:thioredoxin reductase (NADPH)